MFKITKQSTSGALPVEIIREFETLKEAQGYIERVKSDCYNLATKEMYWDNKTIIYLNETGMIIYEIVDSSIPACTSNR